MAASGQRTKINLGAIAVEVSLVKSSSEPAAAKWETKTVNADGSDVAPVSLAQAMAPPFGVPDAPPEDWPTPAAEQAEALISGAHGGLVSGPVADDPLGVEPEHRQPTVEDLGRAIGATEPEPEPPATKTLRGIWIEDVFVDLTDRLKAIDDDVAAGLDGMEIVAAIRSTSVPRERVRGASFVTPVDTTSKRACAMLFYALSQGDRALAVRWTKRTNQALGIIVGSRAHGCLLLLEVEFAANMKPVPGKARLDELAKSLEPGEIAAAVQFVDAIEGRKSDLDDVADERRVRHAELLDAAREGKLDEYDVAHVVDGEVVDDDVDREFAAIIAGQA